MYAGQWTDESGSFVLDVTMSVPFEGTAYDLAQRLGGELFNHQPRFQAVRVATPCGPYCLRRSGCWKYRSFYHADRTV